MAFLFKFYFNFLGHKTEKSLKTYAGISDLKTRAAKAISLQTLQSKDDARETVKAMSAKKSPGLGENKVQCKICGDKYPYNHMESHVTGVHGLDGPVEMYVEDQSTSSTHDLKSIPRPLIKRKEIPTATVTSGNIISGYLYKTYIDHDF